MASPDRPNWQAEAQSFIPKWGTRAPLTATDFESMPALFDVSSRPVFEDETPNPAGAPFVEKDITIKDSRHGLKGNDSAHRTVSGDLKMIRGMLSHIRSVMRPYDRKGISVSTLDEVIYTASALPYFMILRADNPIKNGALDTAVAGVAKVARGIEIPYTVHAMENIGIRYAGGRKTNTDYLQDPTAFYNFVNENGMLISHDHPGRACPVTPRTIMDTYGMLLDSPPKEMAEAAELLSLSDEEIRRAKKFGLAYRTDMFERLAFAEPHIAVSQGKYEQLRELGITSPIQMDNQHGRMLRSQRSIVTNTLNKAYRWANEALGRDNGPKLTEDYLPDPPFQIAPNIVLFG